VRPGKVCLVGGSGQLGLALSARFGDCDLVSTAHRTVHPAYVPLNLGNAAQVTAFLDREQPQIILVAGAMCRVDLCEQEPDLCRGINTRGPAIIAEWARATAARVVFFSTDHVFDGTRDVYREEDAANPLSVYASSKWEAEEAIRRILPDRHLILRTGWVYGPDNERRNFVLQLIDRLRNHEEAVLVPSDQWGCPTFTGDLAMVTRFLLDSDQFGTFHAVGPEPTDRVALARRVCARFGLDASSVVPRPTAELGQIARRSLRVVLDCGKLQATGAPSFRGIDAGLEALMSWSHTITPAR
jgi:dTDP-4-dehydrorhamnose reductase